MERLIARYGPRVLHLLEGVLGERAEAEDAAQETWLSIWRSRGPGRRAITPWAYVRKVALSRGLDRLRQRGLRPDPMSLGVEPVAPEAAAEGVPELARLPEHERVALVLHFWGGLSVREIATRLDVPEGTVKTWMHRGRARLRALLAPTRQGS